MPALKYSRSEPFQQKICLYLTSRLQLAGEFVFEEDTPCEHEDKEMYFISSGLLEIISKHQNLGIFASHFTCGQRRRQPAGPRANNQDIESHKSDYCLSLTQDSQFESGECVNFKEKSDPKAPVKRPNPKKYRSKSMQRKNSTSSGSSGSANSATRRQTSSTVNHNSRKVCLKH